MRRFGIGGVLALALLQAKPATGQEVDSSATWDIWVATFAYLIEHNHAYAAGSPNQLICIDIGAWRDARVPPTVVLRAFADRSPPVRGPEACRLDETRDLPRLIGADVGVPAIAFSVDPPEPAPNGTYQVQASYYEGVLSAASYQCVLERVDNRWRVKRCELQTIS